LSPARQSWQIGRSGCERSLTHQSTDSEQHEQVTATARMVRGRPAISASDPACDRLAAEWHSVPAFGDSGQHSTDPSAPLRYPRSIYSVRNDLLDCPNLVRACAPPMREER
jgi:hypothetical protein